MKIILENFGIIKRAEFDTDDDFTFIIGRNNTGKSYAISALYLILKNVSDLNFLTHLFRNGLIKRDDVWIKEFSLLHKKIIKQLKDKKSISGKENIEILLSEILTPLFLPLLNESFSNTFDSIENLQNRLTKEDMRIKIETDLIKLIIKAKDDEFYIEKVKINKDIIFQKAKRNYKTKVKDNFIKVYITENLENQYNILDVINTMLESFDLKEISDIHFLPASRSGLYQALSAFGQIIAELSKSRKFISRKLELPSISEPVADYFLKLSKINTSSKGKEEISKIANAIEREILKGEVKFNIDTKKLIFKPDNTDLELDLSYTSSMVSEISPIVSFLKFIIKEKESKPTLIIIEEPEAHLHPKVQIELLNKFAELTKNKVKFIITTHSNYMFNKFNNLILSKKLDINKISCLIFNLDNNNGGSMAHKMEMDEYGIEDENFVYTSEELYNEKLDIIEKINNLENE